MQQLLLELELQLRQLAYLLGLQLFPQFVRHRLYLLELHQLLLELCLRLPVVFQLAPESHLQLELHQL